MNKDNITIIDRKYITKEGVEFEPTNRLNELMTGYNNLETGDVERIELKIDIDMKNDDLLSYLLDFGCAGELKSKMNEILANYTKGYCKWRKENSHGTWTPICREFDGTKE